MNNKHENTKVTISSKIRRRAYIDHCFIVVLDTKLVLHYDCDLETFYKICSDLDTASKWKWTFNKSTHKLISWKPIDYTCCIQ